MHDLEQIKADHPLRDWVEKDTAQVAAGKNPMFQCPLQNHDDKNASFTIYPEGKFYCFGCQQSGDLFDYLKLTRGWDLSEAIDRLGGGAEITQEERLSRQIERAEIERQRLEQDIEDAKAVLMALQSERAWERYNASLMEHEEAQRIWEAQGLPYDWQINYDLGYCPDFYMGESITIPIFTPFDQYPINIRHRILGRTDDKYRPEKPGLPTSFYWARPSLGATEQIFLVEGEKKAMVLFRHLYEAGLSNVQVIGAMGAKGIIKPDLVPQLANTKEVYYIPDPDVERERIWKTIKTLGKRTGLLEIPGKVDDMLVDGVLDGKLIVSMTHNAVMVQP